MLDAHQLNVFQDAFIGRNGARPGKTAQKAFWKFGTDPGNPIVHQLQSIVKIGGHFEFPSAGNAESELIGTST